MRDDESPTSQEHSPEDLNITDFSDIETPLTKEGEKKELDLAKGLASKVLESGGRALIVGGYARDEAMRREGVQVESKDIDIEVYNINLDQLKKILDDDFSEFGEIKLVGQAFGVVKVGQVDISLPRRDSKVSPGHRGFEISVDPTLSIEEAAKRRDLTINSLSLDPLTSEFIDPWNGVADIKSGILRATDLASFGEDPLRALRIAQFAARFGFKVDEKTAEICRSLPLNELPPERIGEEWRKLLLKSNRPSIGIEVARDLNILKRLHPELEALIGIQQEPDWHPEGDVWIHSLMSVDVASEIVVREGLTSDHALTIKLAALLHDLGKPSTTETRVVRGSERITSYGHDEAGTEPTRNFLSKMRFGSAIDNRVVSVVQAHMYLASNPYPTESAIRRLSMKIQPSNIQELALVMEADQRGRSGIPKNMDKITNLVRISQELGVREEPQKPIIDGKNLIALGMTPGTEFGIIIRKVQEAYLEGKVKDKKEALEMAADFTTS